MMRTLLIIGLCFNFATSARAATLKYTKLECAGSDGQALYISGLGTNSLTISGSYYVGHLIVTRSMDGDCRGRRTFCAEIGEWMINVQQRLAAGDQRSGYVWENGDVDDRPENNRLGDRYRCMAFR